VTELAPLGLETTFHVDPPLVVRIIPLVLTATPLLASAKDTESKVADVGELTKAQLIPPSVDFAIVPPEPTAHPMVDEVKNTELNVCPVILGDMLQKAPELAVKAVKPFSPTIFPEVEENQKILFKLDGVPLFPIVLVCHDAPPFVVNSAVPASPTAHTSEVLFATTAQRLFDVPDD
jgi:hypothetical protein